jgi:regulator of protease activity HflC (stomatin/prohibitin superfamily)
MSKWEEKDFDQDSGNGGKDDEFDLQFIEQLFEGGGKKSMDRQARFGCTAIGVAVVVIAVVITGSLAYTPVEYGTVRLITRFGAVTGRVLQPGLNWRIPFVDGFIQYRTQEIVYETADVPTTADYYDMPTDTTTADGQQIKLKFSVRFHVDPAEVETVANELGDEAAIVSKVVKFHARILARNIPKQYVAADLYAGDILEVQEQFRTELAPLLAKDGVILDDFGLRQITFEEDYIQAVEQKQIEAERIIAEQYKRDQATFQAEAAVELAKGEANATIERARAEAERKKIVAEAEAEAIRVKGEVLAQYPEIMQFEFIQGLADPNGNVRWGILPADTIVPFLDVTQLTTPEQ